MAVTRSAKRSAAQERLRGSFLAQLEPELRALAELLDMGEDARDILEAELRRIGETSEALSLDDLAEVSIAAADAAASGDDLVELLKPFARAVRKTRPTPRFAPIGIVGDAQLIAEFEAIRATTSEPLVLATDLASLERPLAPVPWAALMVPVDAIDAAREVADGAMVLAWGESKDWDARLKAVGSDGFIPRTGAAQQLLDRVRTRFSQPEGQPEVLVLDVDSDVRDAWLDALFEAGLGTFTSSSPAEIAPALDMVCPDVLILGADIGGVQASDLVRAIRNHGLRSHVPAIVIGDDLDEDALVAAGADDVLPGDIDPQALVERVRIRHERALKANRGIHPITGVLDRAAALRELDHRLGHVVRSGKPLTVGILQLEGLGAARKRYGKAAANAAQRIVAETLVHGLRRLDIIGQISDDSFVVALQDCTERVGRRRIADVTQRAESRLRADHRLREMLCLFGCADTEVGGALKVVQRADAELLAIRTATK